MDKRDWIIGIMGICIIALAYALFFSLPLITPQPIIDADITEPIAIWGIVAAVAILIVMFLSVAFSWYFTLGTRAE